MSKSCVLLYWQRYCTALQQRALAKLCGVVQGMKLRNFHRGCHLYSAGWTSRWASAHILVEEPTTLHFCSNNLLSHSCSMMDCAECGRVLHTESFVIIGRIFTGQLLFLKLANNMMPTRQNHPLYLILN